MVYQVNRFLSRVVDFILPPRCVSCGKSATMLCADCLALIKFVEEPICDICGEPLVYKGLCARCLKQPLSILKIRAATYFGGSIPKIIHQLKYHNMFAVSETLGALMVQRWHIWFETMDIVIPIPLHPKRLKERGYNQSTLLARPLADYLQIPLNERIMQRTQYTQPQATLTAQERQANVQNAFQVSNSDELIDKHILLVDDVCTTGATLSAAAQILLNKGAATVSAYCLARASNKQIMN